MLMSINPYQSEIVANTSKDVTDRVCGETQRTLGVYILALAVALELLPGVDVGI